MSDLTMFDARNDATVRRAMRDVALHGHPVTFGDRVAITFTPVLGWRVHTRASRADVWTLAANGLASTDAVDIVTHYARNTNREEN